MLSAAGRVHSGRVHSLLLTGSAAIGLFLGCVAPAALAAPKPATHTVVIEGVQFEPQMLTVKVGDTVVWINDDPFPHTATARGGQFDSHQIAPGRTWKFTARKAGLYPYTCTFHSTMSATLRVE
jgi:plastocyanin